MKEISKPQSPAKEKSVSSSLTKTSEHLGSNPIAIGNRRVASSSKQPKRQVAQSCPTFTFVPPPPPSTKPRIPVHDPPPMLLPPSPPVFSPMQIQAAQEQLAQVKNVLSRSLTTFSSSCPDPSFLRPPFGIANQTFSDNTASPQGINISGQGDDNNDDDMGRMSELGKSPTIFSLLQGSSVPSSRAPSFMGQAPMSRPGSIFGNRPSNIYENGPDIPEDDLLFSISLDQHDNDGSYLAQSTQDYLHL